MVLVAGKPMAVHEESHATASFEMMLGETRVKAAIRSRDCESARSKDAYTTRHRIRVSLSMQHSVSSF